MSSEIDAMVRQFMREVVSNPGATLTEAGAAAGLESAERIVAGAFARAHGLCYTRRDPTSRLQRYYPQPGEGTRVPDEELDDWMPPTDAEVDAMEAWLDAEGPQ